MKTNLLIILLSFKEKEVEIAIQESKEKIAKSKDKEFKKEEDFRLMHLYARLCTIRINLNKLREE